MTHVRVPVAIAVATLALVSLSALPVAGANPSVRYGFVTGGVAFPRDGSFHQLTGMQIPAGTWWVTATATVDASDANTTATGDTTCRLSAGASNTALDQSAWQLDGNPNANGIESLFLTAVRTSSNQWVLNLDCASNSSVNIVLADIRLTAVRGASSGSTWPRLKSASAGVQNVAAGSTLKTVGSLSLGAGRWWITAKARVENASAGGSNNIRCRVRLSSTNRDSTTEATAALNQRGSKGEIAVQVAHRFTSSGVARLQCGDAQRNFTVQQVRLVAIKAGTLIRRELGGGSSSSGSGTPKVIAAYRSDSSPVSSAGFVTVAQTSLPAGSWLVSAKAQLNNAASTLVQCSLGVETADFDEVSSPAYSRGGASGGSTGLYLQAAHESTGPLSAWLACRASASGVTISNIRITAISAKDLSFVPLSV